VDGVYTLKMNLSKLILVLFINITLFIIVIASILFSLPGKVLAGGLPVEEDGSWYVEERASRIFYFTHGMIVYGHEFGFYKNPADYENDILWLIFSSSEEKVKDFIGKNVVIALDVDGEVFKIKLNMLTAGTMGFTQIMYFTNWAADKQLLDALMNGHHVKVQIVEPKGLEVLLDIKEDTFDLGGFNNSRKQAEEMCKDFY